MTLYRTVFKFPILFSVVCACCFCSCTEDSPEAVSKQTQQQNTNLDLNQENPLLSRLPEGTYALLSFIADGKPYTQYAASRWGQSEQSMVDVLRELQASQQDMSGQFEVFADVLEASGLTGGSENDSIAKALAFSSLKDTGGAGFTLGLIVELAEGNNAGAMIDNMKKAFTRHEFTLGTLDGIGDVALTIKKDIQRPGSQVSIPFLLTLAGSGNYLALCTDAEQLESLLDSKTKTKAFETISTSSLYKKSVRSLGDRTKEYGFAYIDIAAVVPGVQAPPINLQSLSWSRQMLSEGPGEFVSAVVEPRNDKERAYMTLLEKEGKVRSLEQFPADTIAYVGLDLDVWSEAFKHAMSEQERAARKDFLDMIDSLSDIALGVKGSRNTSPFPEILIGMNADKDPSATLKTIEAQFAALLPLTGVNMSSWQESTIDGVPVRYSMTPFGMGVYMGSYNKAAFITSSQSSAKEYIASLKGDAPALIQSLPKSQQALLASSHPIALTAVNFHKLGTLIEVFQSNLALFTGGKSMDQRSIENLKRAGMLMLSLTLSDNVFQLTTHFSEPVATGSK